MEKCVREREGRGSGRHPLLDFKQTVGQMNIEVSVSRTGRGLETDGFMFRTGGGSEE